HADRLTFRVGLDLVARAGRGLGAPADLRRGLVEEEPELEGAHRVRDVDGADAAAIPRRDEQVRERDDVVYGLGAAHGVLAVDAGEPGRRRQLVTLLGAAVRVLLGDRERPHVSRIEVAPEGAHRSGAAGSDELSGLSVVGREAFG